MVFKLVQIAQSRWRHLNGAGLIVKLLDGYRFVDGIAQKKEEKDAARKSQDTKLDDISG